MVLGQLIPYIGEVGIETNVNFDNGLIHLSLMGICRGHLNTACASFSTTLRVNVT